METLWHNLRYGFRLLWKTPGTTIIIILSVALGIGATTAIFSVVNGVLFHPLPYVDPGRLIRVVETNPSQGIDRFPTSPPNFLDWRRLNHVFEDMAVYTESSFTLAGDRDPERLVGAEFSAGMIPILGISPQLGRAFTPEEATPGKSDVVIISYGLWQRVFGADPKIIGKSIRLDGKQVTVVGVMPRTFRFPSSEEQVWVPFVIDEDMLSSRGAKWLVVIARLKKEMNIQQAQADMSAVASALEKEYPSTNKGWGVILQPLQQAVVGRIQRPLFILLAAVTLVLLIACANVANLLMARNAVRRSEVAVRSALGASRAQLLFQFLTESVLLSLLGGSFGLLLAVWGKDALLTMAAGSLPRLDEIAINIPVLLFALVVSVLTGIAFGLLPAFQVSRNLETELHSMQTRGLARSGVRSGFVVAEVALAMILLTGAGLLFRSLHSMTSVSPGFDPHHLLKFQLQTPELRYPERNQVAVLQHELLNQLKTIPGVEGLGITSGLPLTGFRWTLSFDIKGRELPQEDQPSAEFRVVSDEYFRTMKIPLKAGRFFSAVDREGAPLVALINEKMARTFFPGENPIGHEMRIGDRTPEMRTIIGVVGNVKQLDLGSEAVPEMFISANQRAPRYFSVAVRSAVDPQMLIPAIRQKVHSLDRELPLFEVSTMEEVISESVGRQRFSAYLLSLFAVGALCLALIGLYGILSYAVNQRTREIGIRIAVGASGRDVLRLMIASGFRLLLYGIGFGLLGVFAVTRFLATMLYEVEPTDPTTLAFVLALLVAVALIAVSFPAYRASKVDPMRALRYE